MPLSEEVRRKIGIGVSKARKNKPLSESHRQALIGSHKNRPHELCPICGVDYGVNVIERHKAACKGI